MSTAEKGWPFQAWQHIAIRRFNLPPSEFWAMPVGDWLALIGGLKPSGVDQKTLGELLKIYPDEEIQNGRN